MSSRRLCKIFQNEILRVRVMIGAIRRVLTLKFLILGQARTYEGGQLRFHSRNLRSYAKGVDRHSTTRWGPQPLQGITATRRHAPERRTMYGRPPKRQSGLLSIGPSGPCKNASTMARSPKCEA